MICQACNQDKNIVYRDYSWASGMNGSTAISIRVCFDCLDSMDWQYEIKIVLPSLIMCSRCSQKFIPKKKSQTKCGICWKAYFKGLKNGSK